MGISKIGSFFAANIDGLNRPASSQSQGETNQQNAAATQSAQYGAANSEAVVVATSSSRQAAPTESATQRQSKIDELKSKVASGSYKTDSREVAIAVFRDLA